MDLSSLWAKSTAIGASIGAGLPLVAAVILRPHWPARVKRGIVYGLSGVAGLGAVAAAGSLSSSTAVNISTVLAVYAASQVAYTALWHRYGIAQAIETTTSPLVCPTSDCPVSNGVCEKCEKWTGLDIPTDVTPAPDDGPGDGPASGGTPPEGGSSATAP